MPPRSLYLLFAVALAAGVGCAHQAGPRSGADAMDETVAVPTSASASRGSSLYAKNCAACHGTIAPGPIGPVLHNEHLRRDASFVVAIIKHPDPPMPKLFPGTLSAQDVADIAAYVENL